MAVGAGRTVHSQARRQGRLCYDEPRIGRFNLEPEPAGVFAGRMDFFQQDALLPIIQLAITPVILMTALGSLLISMTNRMGRIVDRTRSLAGLVRSSTTEDRQYLEQQLRILYHRAWWIRSAVTLSIASLLCAALLVVVIFVGAAFQTEVAPVIVGLFSAGITFLILSLLAFLRDIFMSLTALALEVKRALPDVETSAWTSPHKR